MLKKNNRITKDKEFERIFKKGKGKYSPILGIKAVDSDLENSRFGIIVSTKISKKAVERNKIKRQIREIIKKHLSNINSGKDIVIITLPKIKEANFEQIEKYVIFCLKNLRLIQ
jgi:ribonuclease P protein component